MRIQRELRDIPDGDPVPGASMVVSRATDGVGVGTVLTNSDGIGELFANGSPGPIKTRFIKGSEIWQDDSRAIMPVGSAEMVDLRNLIDWTHNNGFIPQWGTGFAIQSTGINSVTIGTGAATLDGVLSVHWANTPLTVSDGDIAIVIKQMNADGRTEMTSLAYSGIGAITCVPLWRLTVSGTVLSREWIGTPTLFGIVNRHQTPASVARLASGSTTNGSGEASGLSTTLTLDSGVTYQVQAKASIISRGREGALAVEIDGNLSSYRGNGDDVTVQIKNSHVRTVTGTSVLVRVFERSDTALTDWVLSGPFGAFGTGTAPNFNQPRQIDTDTSGNVYVADQRNARVVKLDSAGAFSSIVLNSQTNIFGVAVDSSGNVYTSIQGGDGTYRIFKYNSSSVLQWFSAANTVANRSYHLATDGTYVYATHLNNVVVKYLASTGAAVAAWGGTGTGNGQFNTPRGITTDGTHVYVADDANSRIQKFTVAGAFVTTWGNAGSDDGEFSSPLGVALDDSGDVWVADSGNNRLQRFSGTGTFQISLSQDAPHGIAIASGDVLWASNTFGHTVTKWDETASAFNWDAGLLHAIAHPRL